MDRYEPFDLKITKLTGKQWDRINMQNLAQQLMKSQGGPRHSVENRIIIAFDNSLSSSLSFLIRNRPSLVTALKNVVWNPYAFTYWLGDIWCGIVLIKEGEYYSSYGYYEHPIGPKMREPDKATFEFRLLKEASEVSGELLKYNPDPKQHGYDGDLYIDRDIIQPPGTQPPLLTHIPVCDYSGKNTGWQNCRPCPLFIDGHCTSRGAKFVHKEKLPSASAAGEEPIKIAQRVWLEAESG